MECPHLQIGYLAVDLSDPIESQQQMCEVVQLEHELGNLAELVVPNVEDAQQLALAQRVRQCHHRVLLEHEDLQVDEVAQLVWRERERVSVNVANGETGLMAVHTATHTRTQAGDTQTRPRTHAASIHGTDPITTADSPMDARPGQRLSPGQSDSACLQGHIGAATRHTSRTDRHGTSPLSEM